LYAYSKGNIYLSTATSIALLWSFNHLRNKKPGYRRTIYLITSNIYLYAYFYFGYTSLGLMTYLYNNSYTNFYLQDKTWETYHIGFHLLSTISKMYLIYWV
jgi:hypothetical protein